MGFGLRSTGLKGFRCRKLVILKILEGESVLILFNPCFSRASRQDPPDPEGSKYPVTRCLRTTIVTIQNVLETLHALYSSTQL